MELKELLIKIQNDEMDYFDEFYEQTKRPVFNLIYSYLRDSDDTEDILQDTYIKFLRYKKKVKADGNILSYLFEIGKTLSLNHLKKSKRTEIMEDTDHIADEEKKSNLEESELNQVMKETLNETEYQIVILHVVNGMTHKEIAALLGKPLGTITWAYNNAIGKLRGKMS